MSDPSVSSGEPSLAVKIDSEKTHPLAWKTVAKRAVVVLVVYHAIFGPRRIA